MEMMMADLKVLRLDSLKEKMTGQDLVQPKAYWKGQLRSLD